MEKIDFKKEMNDIYGASAKDVTIVEVPEINYLMIDGEGDPNNCQAYQDAIMTLYPVAYNIKFLIKKEKKQDYKVMPLEGLWWTDDMDQFSLGDKDNWKWTSMIMQPEFVTNEIFERAVEDVRKKKDPPSLSKLRFDTLTEGFAAQILHIGPYSAEQENIIKLHDFIREKGYKFDGLKEKHHEIYLSDARRTPPEKLKTIIRQPFQKGE